MVYFTPMNPQRINLIIPSDRRVIVPVPVVVQPRRLVVVLPRKAVALGLGADLLKVKFARRVVSRAPHYRFVLVGQVPRRPEVIVDRIGESVTQYLGVS